MNSFRLPSYPISCHCHGQQQSPGSGCRQASAPGSGWRRMPPLRRPRLRSREDVGRRKSTYSTTNPFPVGFKQIRNRSFLAFGSRGTRSATSATTVASIWTRPTAAKLPTKKSTANVSICRQTIRSSK